MTVTHVDTSTGVIADVKGLAALGRRYDALVVVDGVCSVAGEELRMGDWGVDVALTASQKAIGVPPGLALLVAGPRAMTAFASARSPWRSFYADWTHWLPIMEAYEARKAGLFWHAGRQPGVGAERQPGTDPGRGDRRPLRAPQGVGAGLPAGHRRPGVGPGAVAAGIRRPYHDRASLAGWRQRR